MDLNGVDDEMPSLLNREKWTHKYNEDDTTFFTQINVTQN